MNRSVKVCILFFLLLGCINGFSQSCQSKYYSRYFSGTTYDTFTHSAFTPTGELLVSGNLLDYNGAAHLALFNRNGEQVWSNYYTIDYFTFYNPTFFSKVKINDFVVTPEGDMIVAGTILRYYNNRVFEIYNQLALLAKINKYGIVQWFRTYQPAVLYPDLSFSDICLFPNGDIVAYMANDQGPALYYHNNSFNRVVRFSSDGTLKWATSLYTGEYDAGGLGVFFKRGLNRMQDNTILVADVVYTTKRNSDVFRMMESRIHISGLDFATGKPLWESSMPYSRPATDSFFIPDIPDVSQLPDGKIAVSTSLYLSTPGSPALTKKPVTLLANNRGVIQSMQVISDVSGLSLRLVDVSATAVAGQKKYLLARGNQTFVATLNPDGSVADTKGYNSAFPPNCMAVGPRGTAIFQSNNQSLQFQLLLTNASGNITCKELTTELVTESVIPFNETPSAVATAELVYTPADYKSSFVDMGYPLRIKSPYPLPAQTDCEEALECCRDVINTSSSGNVTICEGSSYRLPDNTMVKDSGTYFIVYKTAAGCDSITFINIKVDKSLVHLSLGQDTCMEKNAGGILLHATKGYNAYSWMNFAPTAADSFRVNNPGTYKVSVTNACGRRTDSIELFERCDFPVFVPTAFTPNGDGLNDFFGIPPDNKNRLLSLRVYNRWGEIVFQTNDPRKRWDGTFKNQVLRSDVFVFFAEMRGLSGNILTKKGTVLLIRD